MSIARNLHQSLTSCLRSSRFAATLLVFLLVNATLGATNPVKGVDPESLPLAKSWVWWAVHDFGKESSRPNVILLGSSLLMNPVWQKEANFLNANFDIVANRRTKYLESAIRKQAPGTAPVCFNFALPGSLVSDDYMIIRTMLNGKQAPPVVVLALSPRDFIENGLRCPAFSPPFRYLKRFTALDDLVAVAMPHFWQRIGYYTDRAFFFLGKRLELQTLAGQGCRQIAESYLGPANQNAAPAAKACQQDSVINAIYREDLIEGVWIAKPHMTPPYNPGGVEIYRDKFRDARMIDNQKQWLEMTLALCRQRGIKVVILNMPVTRTNLTVYPPGVYDRCVAAVREEAQRFGCRFVDLERSNQFFLADFTDMWHMNADGGRKVLDCAAREICDDGNLARALSVYGHQSETAEKATPTQL